MSDLHIGSVFSGPLCSRREEAHRRGCCGNPAGNVSSDVCLVARTHRGKCPAGWRRRSQRRNMCKAGVGWGLCFAEGSSLYSSLVRFKAMYQEGHGPRPVYQSMPHFIAGETEAQGKEETDTPSKAFMGIRHRAQHMPASCADRSEQQGAQHFCKLVLPVEDYLNPAWSPP